MSLPLPFRPPRKELSRPPPPSRRRSSSVKRADRRKVNRRARESCYREEKSTCRALPVTCRSDVHVAVGQLARAFVGAKAREEQPGVEDADACEHEPARQ